MYTQEEIYKIINSCNTVDEVMAAAKSFSHLILCCGQHSLQLINKLSCIKIQFLSDGSQVK